MSRHVNAIAGRLSLRDPQRESLEILARVTEIVPPRKEYDLAAALAVIRSEFPTVTDFERDFPSLCFALATGVGKTRLMGAFISYLRLAHGIRHFFVLAPNLTIYNKLIGDFTPNTPKYVFHGIGEFANQPPEVITGEDYQFGRGARNLFGDDSVHINIFNISKINSEVRGGAAPRIKRLSEYIGQSYFDYLAGLDDLVLLMDESHRYRATRGVQAINELKPILGLELTATPRVEAAGGPIEFRNVIYSYPLSKALTDGFVKEPAVATRENFKPENYEPGELERIKLEDGVKIHRETKVELQVFAGERGLPVVKPFMLVVAQDTDHANSLLAMMKSDSFFNGEYADKVITVHSNQKGEERDETLQLLLGVEDPNNPTEIVIHVNKLKEGWDVTNLYTIVPLRAATSTILTEQTIGRGLRLPYGKRTGIPIVDRLTIVAHDKFQAIIDQANRPDSIIRTGVYIGKDVAVEKKEAVVVQPIIVHEIAGTSQGTIPFVTKVEQDVARLTYDLIRKLERLPSSARLSDAEVQAELVAEVRIAYATPQTALQMEPAPNIPEIVAKTCVLYNERSIDIPRITLVPIDDVSFGFHEFDLDVTAVPRFQPVDHEILIQHIRTHERFQIAAGSAAGQEPRLEDYIVRELIEKPDICYDEQATLLYDLSGQAVAYFRSYLSVEADVANVVQYHHRQLAEIVHTQLQKYAWKSECRFEVNVSKGFNVLRSSNFSIPAGAKVRNFRDTVDQKLMIRGMLFGGFSRCLYPVQRFQSDTERLFAMVCETSAGVLKWFKPAAGQFQIEYASGQMYEPDFVVETATEKLICEPKMRSELQYVAMSDKSRAAVTWCSNATQHALENDGKPWHYLLIPHDAITAASSLGGLRSSYTLN